MTIALANKPNSIRKITNTSTKSNRFARMKRFNHFELNLRSRTAKIIKLDRVKRRARYHKHQLSQNLHFPSREEN